MDERLESEKFIPLSKYWSLRLGFLDIVNETALFLPQIENREDLGDDARKMIIISREWRTKNEHNVGEGGALFRYLQFASWKYNLEKKFIKEGTLKDRKMCDNPEIVNWPLEKLLELDNSTPQWASVSILLGNREEVPDNYFLNLSKEALEEYGNAKQEKRFCELRYDETLTLQAEAFIDALGNRRVNYVPEQQDEYCFARVFNLIGSEEGERRWPELRGHESNRLKEMEKMIGKYEREEEIDSKDHRVVQAISMRGVYDKREAKFAFPECVSKSWPRFWDFIKYIRESKNYKG